MFAVSTGKINITPRVKSAMAGYGVDVPRLSTGANSPLYARCTIIWDDGAPNVVVTVDVLGFRASTHRQIRTAVTALGIPSADFVLTATHTHNGPVLTEGLNPYIAYGLNDLSAVDSYTTRLVTAIVGLVAQTRLAARTACTLDYTVADADFSANREGLAYDERDVPVLVARDAAGDPRAVIFSYGAHPVAANSQRLFDPDYPSPAIATIESQWPSCFAQFLTGPAGDQNPTSVAGFADVARFGGDLGATVVAAIGTPGRRLDGPITAVYTEVPLPLDVSLNAGGVAEVRADYVARSKNTAASGFARRHAKRIVQLIDTTPMKWLESEIVLPVQRWKIGGDPGLAIIFSGGEVVSGFAVVMRREFGGTDEVFFAAYANEVPAYIPSDELLSHPGYAGGYDADFPGIAGGSMSVYDHWAHFRRRTGPGGPDGVEQVYLDHLRTLMATP
jgi:neutral ceramidase